MGFTWCGDKLIPRPKCIVCGLVLSNEAMVPSKLLRHFSTKHDHLSKKTPEYFKDLIRLQEKQSKSFVKKYTIAERVQEASYLVAEIIIYSHLTSLEEQINHYFPDISVNLYDWIRNPFVESTSEISELSLIEVEELIDIRNDRTLRLKHSEMCLNSFWITIMKEHPNIGFKALNILLQFSTSYLCELGFSALVNIKTKKRERLKTLENEMRVCLSKTRPNIKEICKHHHAHISH